MLYLRPLAAWCGYKGPKRLRDGSLENLQATDFTGTANFNETFPLFSWYTVETDVTRYKNTGTHAVYDAGGPADNSQAWCGSAAKAATAGYPTCGTSTIASNPRSFFAAALPCAENLATAARGVAFDAWPPVFE